MTHTLVHDLRWTAAQTRAEHARCNGKTPNLQLPQHGLVCLACFALGKRLADARDDREAAVDGVLGLGSDVRVSLALGAALGVANDAVLDAQVSQHVRTGFARESAVSSRPDVL